MNLETTLDKIHDRVVKNRILQLFTVFTRVLLAIGFIPPSIKKILHQPFTILPDSNPVGHYFNALYQTGFYYEFIGWAQLAAAVLLLFPRTAHLGAVMFLPIIINIAVLTNAVGFVGTWLVTILMSLAALYLVCWEYDRIKPVFFHKRESKANVFKLEFVWLPLLGIFGGICVTTLFYVMGIGNFHRNITPVALTLTTGGFIFGLIVAVQHRFMRIGNLEKLSNATLD